MRFRIATAAVLASLTLAGCASTPGIILPPDPVTAENYTLITGGMTKEQVFAILGPGTQQSETTMSGMALQNYVWKPRFNPYAQVLVMFKDGAEMSKVKVGL